MEESMAWLSDVSGLFSDVLMAAYTVPVFRLFLGLIVFLVILGLLRLLFASGRRL